MEVQEENVIYTCVMDLKPFQLSVTFYVEVENLRD